MEVVGALIGTFVTIVFLIGLPANISIIIYLSRKPIQTKTAFDLVLIDSLLSALAYSVSAYFLILISITFAPLSPLLANIYCISHCCISQLLLISGFTTMFLKYLYMFHGYFIHEFSDSDVRRIWCFLKILLLAIFTIMDNFLPVQNVPAFFKIISEKDQERYYRFK